MVVGWTTRHIVPGPYRPLGTQIRRPTVLLGPTPRTLRKLKLETTPFTHLSIFAPETLTESSWYFTLFSRLPPLRPFRVRTYAPTHTYVVVYTYTPTHTFSFS